MATSEFSDFLGEASNTVHVNEFYCTPCEDNGLQADGLFYCQLCCKLFCLKCNDLHGQILNDHTVLTNAEQAKWGPVKRVSTLLMCEKHDGKEVEMYCEDHDHVICTICVSLEHRSCKTVKHIPAIATGISQTPDFKALYTNVGKLTNKLDQLAKARKRNSTALHKESKRIVDSLNNLEQKLIQQLAKLKKEVEKDMTERLAENDSMIEKDISECNTVSENLKKLIKDMHSKGRTNGAFAFISMKKCQRALAKAQERFYHLNTGNYEINFNIDTDLENVLSTAKFGHFKEISMNPKHVYKATKVATHNVTMTSDLYACNITGICILRTNQVVLADLDNCKFKLLNDQYKVVSDYECSSFPCDVCSISDHEICAACNYYLQFLEVTGEEIQATNKVNVFHHVCAVSCYDNQLYVGGGGDGIYVYTTLGQLIHKLYEGYAYRLSTSLAGTKLYVTTSQKYAKHNSLVVLDQYGSLLEKIKTDSLTNSTGVCILPNGNVLMAGNQTNNVVQMNANGETVHPFFLTVTDGIDKPNSLCFNAEAGTLLVGQDNQTLLVIKLM